MVDTLKPESEEKIEGTAGPVCVTRWQAGRSHAAADLLAEEAPVALVFNGISHVVMMALPKDLDLLALGFSISEGIIGSSNELYDVEIQKHSRGFEVLLTISSERLHELKQRRRNLAGRTGCGLCGSESLEQAVSPVTRVRPEPTPSNDAVQVALRAMEYHQELQRSTGACHGAAWCDSRGEILQLFEDIGRHNALDKLIGSLHRTGSNLSEGFVLISSRASYEMVHKAAAAGIASLVAVSAPTSLAVEMAREAGINLTGFARPGRHVTYVSSHSGDIKTGIQNGRNNKA